ncbi:DUF6082 family protein [Streptomyces sp. NPDC048309]|uniref:DUF6082 family protein n=1 Tax=Streptomyces sp. NPDC048309 TaxID=3154618 RepID=UPI0033F9FEBB
MVADQGECTRTAVVYGARGSDANAVVYDGQLTGERYRVDREGRRNWPTAAQFMCASCMTVRASVWDHCHTHGFVRAPLCTPEGVPPLLSSVSFPSQSASHNNRLSGSGSDDLNHRRPRWVCRTARGQRTRQEEAQRASHRQLVVMSLSDPDLIVCWERIPNAASPLEAKQIGFTNLIISNWSADYQLKRFNDDALRVLLREHFRGEIARKHWQNGGSQWRQIAEALGDSRGIRFASLVDEVYTQAVSEGPPIPPSAYFSAVG